MKDGTDDGLIYTDLQERRSQEEKEAEHHFGHFGSAYSGNTPGLARLGMLWSGDDASRTALYLQDAKFGSLPTFEARAAAVKRWLFMNKSDSYDLQMRMRKKYGRFSLLPLGPEPDCPRQSDDDYDHVPVDPPTMTPAETSDPKKDGVNDSDPVHVMA